MLALHWCLKMIPSKVSHVSYYHVHARTKNTRKAYANKRTQNCFKFTLFLGFFIHTPPWLNNAIQRCGFTAATAAWLVEQGFETTSEDLLAASKSDIDTLA